MDINSDAIHIEILLVITLAHQVSTEAGRKSLMIIRSITTNYHDFLFHPRQKKVLQIYHLLITVKSINDQIHDNIASLHATRTRANSGST